MVLLNAVQLTESKRKRGFYRLGEVAINLRMFYPVKLKGFIAQPSEKVDQVKDTETGLPH